MIQQIHVRTQKEVLIQVPLIIIQDLYLIMIPITSGLTRTDLTAMVQLNRQKSFIISIWIGFISGYVILIAMLIE